MTQQQKHLIDIAVAKIAKDYGFALPDADLISFGTAVWIKAKHESCPHCGYVEVCSGRSCDNCPSRDGHFITDYQDSCPTDRGTESRDFELWLCDDCADEWRAKHA